MNNTRTWPVFAVAGAVMVLLLGVAWLNRPRAVDGSLVRYLPESVSTIVAIDVGALGRLGLLPAEADAEGEYRQFAEAIGFHYQRDLESLVAGFDGPHAYFVARGRFQWEKLRAHAQRQGGACQASHCRMPGATPGRQVAWFPLDARTIALATSPDANVVNFLAQAKAWPGEALTPRGVAWLTTRDPGKVAPPEFAQSLVAPFAGAERVSFWLDQQQKSAGIRVAGRWPDTKAAALAARRLGLAAKERELTGFLPLPGNFLSKEP